MNFPNWLIPTGTLTFSGDEKKLRARVEELDGKLLEDSRFTCVLGTGAYSFRFKMPCRFTCDYQPAEGGFALHWSARPKASGFAFFGALALGALAALATGAWELSGMWATLLALLAFLFGIQRDGCIEEFRKHFKG